MIRNPEPPVIPFSQLVDSEGEIREFGALDDTSYDNLRVEAILSVLSKRQRRVAILISEGYKPVEIARQLGLKSVWAVYRITLRIRDRLISVGGVPGYGRRRY